MPAETQTAEQKADDYAANLLDVPLAASKFRMSDSTFLRFRQRHNIALLPGKQVHVDDIIAALNRERKP